MAQQTQVGEQALSQSSSASIKRAPEEETQFLRLLKVRADLTTGRGGEASGLLLEAGGGLLGSNTIPKERERRTEGRAS